MSRYWQGVCLVVLCAVAFPASSVTAVIAYEGGDGANPLAVIVIRFAGAIGVVCLLLKATGAPMRLPTPERNRALVLGILVAAHSWFLYVSFETLAVGLVMVIFYVYPLLVGVVTAITGEERMTARLAGALCTAFAGMVLVFDVTGDGLDAKGALHAAGAAVVWTALTILMARLIRGRDPRPFTLHSQLSAAAIFVAICLVSGEVELPETQYGWIGFAALPALYAVAVICFFAGIATIGPVRTPLLMNLEAVVSIVFGYLILDQALTDMQLAGAGLVILAIVAVRWRREPDRLRGRDR